MTAYQVAPPGSSRLGLFLGIPFTIVVGLAVGVGLGVIGNAITPLAIVALPLLGFWLAAVLRQPAWAIVALFAVMPFSLQRVSAGTFEIIDLAAVVAVGAVALARLVRRQHLGLPVPWVLGWGVALCALAAISVTSSLDRTTATDQLLVLLASFLLACAVVAACERLRDLRLLTVAFFVAGCAVCIEGFTTSTTVTNFGRTIQTRAVGPFQSPNELGSFAAMLLLVALGVLLSRMPRSYRILAALTGVLALSALILSLSRGAWLGALAGIAVLVVFVPRAWRVLVAVGILGALLGLVIGAFNADPTQVQTLQTRFNQVLNPSTNPYDQRPAIWAEAEREIAAKPLFGYGPGNFPVASARSGSEAVTIGAVHAHDVLLTVGAELGLPAAAVVVALTLGIGGAAWRARRSLLRAPEIGIVGGLSAALAAMVVHGLVDFTLRNSTIMALLWVLAAMVIAADRVSRGTADPSLDARRALART